MGCIFDRRGFCCLEVSLAQSESSGSDLLVDHVRSVFSGLKRLTFCSRGFGQLRSGTYPVFVASRTGLQNGSLAPCSEPLRDYGELGKLDMGKSSSWNPVFWVASFLQPWGCGPFLVDVTLSFSHLLSLRVSSISLFGTSKRGDLNGNHKLIITFEGELQ